MDRHLDVVSEIDTIYVFTYGHSPLCCKIWKIFLQFDQKYLQLSVRELAGRVSITYVRKDV